MVMAMVMDMVMVTTKLLVNDRELVVRSLALEELDVMETMVNMVTEITEIMEITGNMETMER